MNGETLAELAFISLGSNIHPEDNLPRAVQALETLGTLLTVSNVYQNPAVGPTPQADFLNAAALVRTRLPALDIRTHLRTIEADLGRVRSADKYAPRTIDLDLCLLGASVLDHPDLQLPDPGIVRHAHLAIPLAELMPAFLHPVLNEPLKDLAGRLLPEADLTLRPDVQLQKK